MKYAVCFTAIIVILCCMTPVQAKDAEAYIEEAGKLNEAGKLDEAIALLEKALEEHPADAGIHAYLGLYTGESAGRAGDDYIEAMRLVTESFTFLDKAVSLAPENPLGYLFRGIMGVQIPAFLGRLNGGISDLEHVVDMNAKNPGSISDETLVTTYTHLATGYEKQGVMDMARGALEKIVELAPGTDAATAAEKKMAGFTESAEPETSPLAPVEGDPEAVIAIKKRIEQDPDDKALVMELGKAYYDAGSYGNATEVMKRYVELDGTSAEAYKMLGISIAMVAGKGYDENIYRDTDFLSNLAFESIGYMDRAVELNPNDPETRLTRGIFGIMFPFFVGKHEQGVEDLEYVTKSGAPDSLKAEALYYLGMAKQREAMRYWIEVAKSYPEEEAARMVYREMRPSVPRFDPSSHQKPLVAIDFVLGFRDELPPQTAVWVEDANGAYVNTVYVSGFSGHAREKQINLPVWSTMSNFEVAEAVTSASIDVGHHIFAWDMTGMDGKPVAPGTYTIKVEVSYWPTMKYQLAEAAVSVGKKEDRAAVEEGDYIPQLVVTYYPK